MQTHSIPAGVAGTPRSFTAHEVFQICREEVYPPCKKSSDSIRLHDTLRADLGYLAATTALLAMRTNQVFALEDELHFSAHDLELLDNVQDHLFAICKRLDRTGRLVEKD
jgi:hypothetical protein